MLTQQIINSGGTVVPLLLEVEGSLFNPSILIHNSKILVNIRSCQYTLYHSEKQRFPHSTGPLAYLNPEDDISLTTKNYLCELDEDLNIKSYKQIDTYKHDKKPLWTFVGLEDGRLVCWDDKLYLCGVRRDTTTNGEGRMELSEIVDCAETSRIRIPAPAPNKSYCEKNWMPVLDNAYTFVKWNNPVEVVHFDGKDTKTVKINDKLQFSRDLRGGSQLVPYKDGYVSIVHETSLFKNENGSKNGIYRHRFVHYSKDFDIVSYSEPFSFMNANIEFCAGLAIRDNDVFISWGFQDNAAFIARTNLQLIEELLCNHF